MMSKLLIVALLAALGIALATAGGTIPDKFLGSFDVGESDNFDEYLSAKGYSWFMTKLVKMASINKVFEKNATLPGTYNCKIDTSKTDVEWLGWQAGKEFEGQYLDEAQHKITIYYDAASDKLIEKHTLVAKPTEKPEIYEYQINDKGELVMRMETGEGNDKVVTHRYYIKRKV